MPGSIGASRLTRTFVQQRIASLPQHV